MQSAMCMPRPVRSSAPSDKGQDAAHRGEVSTPMRRHCFVFAAIGPLFGALSSSAHADVYAGYKGVPFNPAVGGGPNIPATVKAGPYPIPGRLDLINYDMGGSGVGYQTLDHFAYG